MGQWTIDVILPAGRLKPAIASLCEHYQKAAQAWANLELKTVKPSNNTGSSGKREEAQRMLKHTSERQSLILLDERGESLSSRQWADLLNQHRHSAWLIGSADGLDPGLRQQAHTSICLSPMTLAHQLALILVMEQCYRALSLLHQHPYHRDNTH